MRCSKVIEILEKQSPRKFACDWDNVGLLVGRKEKEVEKVISIKSQKEQESQ